MEVLRRSSVFAAEIMDAFDRSPTDKELVAQAKALGREFVHARLLRAGLSWSAPERAALAPGGRLAEVCTVLLRLGSGPLTMGTEVLTSSHSQFWEWALGEQEAAKMDPAQSSPSQVWGEADTRDELELIRPSIYRNVARQLNISLHSESVVTDAFLAVAAQIFAAAWWSGEALPPMEHPAAPQRGCPGGQTGITWGKVVSLYLVAAGLAVDCVRQAQPAMVHALVDCLGEFVRKTLATWLRRRGGWTDILKCVVSSNPGFHSHWLVTALCSFGRFLKAAFFVLLPER
ncbi:bcl-2-related ovarian killer protein isoform X1 [Myotis daubentonii]|uniref:bcl-2-related ovarian killer protein isoform X1 n=1 Tax=Myotis daubentonii TaxID=98922 RepID=UPI002873ABF8|nr:bcl-2-related ovarian killer protein isoform X1 [Myotis daubentonii]